MEPWYGLNGALVVAHDVATGTTYIQLPSALQRPIEGGCRCPECTEVSRVFPNHVPKWDTLAIPTQGTAWTVHMPNAPAFRAYLRSKQG